jgi:hypothetical protein
MARREMGLDGNQGEMALMPSSTDVNNDIAVLRVTVFGPNCPQRAMEPKMLVGRTAAQRVSISPDRGSIRDYFPTMPRSRARIRVRYGESQEGTLEKAFQREDVRPLPTECGG